MDGARIPDFFLVGAAKSATTAMCQYLRAHPEIFLPEQKEIPYFGSDLIGSYPASILSERDYLNHFKDTDDAKRVGTAWALYIYSAKAAKEIKAFAPDGDILIMLRNPVEMLYSFHSQLLYTGMETIPDFEEALEAAEDRKRGRRLPDPLRCPPACFQYLDVARYAEQVERYFDAFGEDHVHVILYDDFKANAPAVYRQTLTFLGVSETFAPSFEVVNPNKRTRSGLLHRLLISRSAVGRKVLHALPSWAQDALRRTRRRAIEMNTRYTPRPPMPSSARRRLQEELGPEIDRIGALLGRDLSHWKSTELTEKAR